MLMRGRLSCRSWWQSLVVCPDVVRRLLKMSSISLFIAVVHEVHLLCGKSNYTGILSKDDLICTKPWLLPLRFLVSAVAAENRNDCDSQLAHDAICALNPVELVLYRCIELVEEELKRV